MTRTHALFLAVLLCAPIALLIWQRRNPSGLDRPAQDAEAAERATRTYRWAVLAVMVWLAIGVAGRSLDLQHNIETAALLLVVTGGVLIAPSYPLAGPASYGLLSYTFGRDDTVTTTLMNLGGTSAIAALSVAATFVWWRRRGGPLLLPGGLLGWSVALFAGWIAVSVLTSMAAGRPLDPALTWRAARYAQAVGLFYVAAVSRPGLGDIRAMVLALSAALVVRQVFLTSYWLFEQNLAILTVVTVPMALTLAFCRPFSRLQIPLGLLSAYMAAMLLYVQNRGAVVGLAAACLGMWPLARRRWLGLLALLTLPMVVGYWAFEAGLLDRFRQIYADGRFLGSAAERLAIWKGGLEIAREHWLFGVGPGNFEFALRALTGGRLWMNAHNSYIELLVEEGAPALGLYLLIFLGAAVRLAGAARRFPNNWRRTVGAGLLGSFAAHLAAGTFLSNPSLVWTWTLIGVAASLSGAAGPGDVGLQTPQRPSGE